MYSRQHCRRIRRNDQGHLRKNQGYQRHAHGLAGMADESQNAGRRTLKLLLHRPHDGGIIGCPKKGRANPRKDQEGDDKGETDEV